MTVKQYLMAGCPSSSPVVLCDTSSKRTGTHG
jgi:hypothetical protein